jgi:single-stranded DNA-specific DHH superfamily exonuclease
METRVEQACRNCSNIKNRQTKIRDDNLEIIKNLIEEQDLLTNKILTVQLSADLSMDRNLTGLIANQLMSEYQRPVLLLNRVEREDGIYYEGSARNVGHSKFDNFRDFMAENPLVDLAQGHQAAFGAAISEANISQFIQESNEKLKEFDFSPCYKVDYIFSHDDMNLQDLADLAALKDIWGQAVEEPLIAIEHIVVHNDNVKLMSADKNPTLKITLSNGLSLIKFRSSQEEYESLCSQEGCVTINIVGKCKQNIWNGIVSNQILIDDYEIVGKVAYYF